jgi:hypothetical protein
VAIIGGISLIVTGLIAYIKDLQLKRFEIENKEMKSQLAETDDILTEANIKINILDKLGNFGVFNEIRTSVDRIFSETRADRFLILFALNGKKDFRTVSVVFEQHKHPELKVNAIIRYRDVQVDDEYRRLLKNVETFNQVTLDTETMPNQLLKDFYTIEQVSHSLIKFLHRKAMDKDNDMVMFCSIATHESDTFDNLEKAIIKTELEGTITRVIKDYI